MPSSVLIDHVSVVAAGRRIIDDVSLRIEPGQAMALIGRSGAGKTTILKLLNGLASPTSGSVAIDDATLTGDLTARRRRIGSILQTPALFPHRTILDNISTVPRLLGWPREKTEAAARELLAQLSMPLAEFGARFPRSLSGGEQQRVAIARAMITGPPLLLCDEPFSALDPLVRRELQDAFVKLRRVTMLFVTHDLAEALRVAERIVLIDGGRIVCDRPRAEFLKSDLPLVRRFIDAARLPKVADGE